MERSALPRDAGLGSELATGPILVVIEGAAGPRIGDRIAAGAAFVGRSLVLVAEIAGLWAINSAGYLVVERLGLPLPGNVAGMLLLFALLCTGVVPQRLFSRSSALLTRHLAFFFIPIAVGLMDLAGIFIAHGATIAVVLVGSAVVGFCAAGGVAQALSSLHKAKP